MKSTTLCYLERGNQYLMLHRTKKENDLNHDKWLGVGGKFEEGESPEDCMLREVLEETGYTVTQWRYCGIVTFISDVWEAEHMHLFVCTEWTGNEIECNEGDLEWIDKKQLLELTLWEGDKIFLKLIDEHTPFFSLKLTYQGDNLQQAVLNGKEINVELASGGHNSAFRIPNS
ncbi:MAG: 8-oxo-dGTP diphosphatase [Bacteroidales bacterium]|nr:8-oxo-dGTP diphosphatase [Bacteroidales bacterium]